MRVLECQTQVRNESNLMGSRKGAPLTGLEARG